MDWEPLGEATLLIGVGMVVVFAVLAILMVAIIIINRWVPEKAKKAEGLAMLKSVEAGTYEKERVAALAVALAKAMDAEGAGIPVGETVGVAAWSGEPSRWAVMGREQAMRSRRKAGRQWGRRSG